MFLLSPQKQRMAVPHGPGPWFAALLIDACPTSSSYNQSKIVIHTYPHLFTNAFNEKEPSSFWVVLLKVGPFECWSKGFDFSNQWNHKTRNNCVLRIDKLSQLCQQPTLNITVWIQNKDKKTIKQDYMNQKSNNNNNTLTNPIQIYKLKELIHK